MLMPKFQQLHSVEFGLWHWNWTIEKHFRLFIWKVVKPVLFWSFQQRMITLSPHRYPNFMHSWCAYNIGLNFGSYHACRPIQGDHLCCSTAICSIRTVSFPCQKRKSSRKLIVPLQSFQGQQVKGLAIMERRISETFKIWPVIYHYP